MPRRPLHPRKFQMTVYLTEPEKERLLAFAAEMGGLDLSVAARMLMLNSLRARDILKGKAKFTDE